jgi:membrane-bound metal-dependent hydrolase YbcI (DUF457 family)
MASVIGSFLPDVDSDSGTPFRIVFDLFAFTGGCLVFYGCLQHTTLSWPQWILLPPIVVVIIRYGIGSIFRRFTRHRGIFHSIPAVLIATFSTPILLRFFVLSAGDIAAISLSVGLGYLSHLILDEVYATVNFEGSKFTPKKSLGSALSFTGSSQRITGAAYALVLILVVFNWPLLSQLLRET